MQLGGRKYHYWPDKGIDLKRFEGIHAVMSKIGLVLTVYRKPVHAKAQAPEKDARAHFQAKSKSPGLRV